MNKEAFDRLELEHKELIVKSDKLKIFMDTDIFKELDGYNKCLLQEQLEYMSGYSRILRKRIELNKEV